MDYHARVSVAKEAATQALLKSQRENQSVDLNELAHAVDELNRSWGMLTDALVRESDECFHQINRLIRELAEAKH